MKHLVIKLFSTTTTTAGLLLLLSVGLQGVNSFHIHTNKGLMITNNHIFCNNIRNRWAVSSSSSSPSSSSTLLFYEQQQDGGGKDAERKKTYHYESIIDDGDGHIRSELASSIWNWDHEHRLQEKQEQEQKQGEDKVRISEGQKKDYYKDNNTKFKYSTRKGLRLVEDIAKELLDTVETPTSMTTTTTSTMSTSITSTSTSRPSSYSDLIQEGVVALMYAMSDYDPLKTKNHIDTEIAFENFAKSVIYSHMYKYLSSSRPINIPGNVHKILRKAKKSSRMLQSRLQREPTIDEIASDIGVTPNNLQVYMLVGRRDTISVESTLCIESDTIDSLNFDDDFDDDINLKYQNQNQFDDESIWDDNDGDNDDITTTATITEDIDSSYEEEESNNARRNRNIRRRRNKDVSSLTASVAATSTILSESSLSNIQNDVEFDDISEDNIYETDGDDELFYTTNQFTVPLRDAIPDYDYDDDTDTSSTMATASIISNNNDNNDIFYDDNDGDDDGNNVHLQDLIRYDVDNLLVETLDNDELDVIKMRFGIHFDNDDEEDGSSSNNDEDGMTIKQISKKLHLPIKTVLQIELNALNKLRMSYKKKYFDDNNNNIHHHHNHEQHEDQPYEDELYGSSLLSSSSSSSIIEDSI